MTFVMQGDVLEGRRIFPHYPFRDKIEHHSMRIWDIPPQRLCRSHLLGEHRELHAIWVVLTRKKKGYSRHPETLRWKGKLAALYERHQKLVREMQDRGWRHSSCLDRRLAKGSRRQAVFIDSCQEQAKILRRKKCPCRI